MTEFLIRAAATLVPLILLVAVWAWRERREHRKRVAEIAAESAAWREKVERESAAFWAEHERQEAERRAAFDRMMAEREAEVERLVALLEAGQPLPDEEPAPAE